MVFVTGSRKTTSSWSGEGENEITLQCSICLLKCMYVD